MTDLDGGTLLQTDGMGPLAEIARLKHLEPSSGDESGDSGMPNETVTRTADLRANLQAATRYLPNLFRMFATIKQFHFPTNVDISKMTFMERDQVARMNTHLKDDAIDNLIRLHVPELTFDYGGGIRLTATEYKLQVKVASKEGVYEKYVEVIDDDTTIFKDFAENSKTKGRIYRKNRLSSHEDADIIRKCKTPAEYWKLVFRRHPIQPGNKIKDVIHNLGKIAPDRQPSESKVYLEVKKKLERIASHRTEHQYKVTGQRLNIPLSEELEALRIFGSATYGFGTLPNQIEYLLTKTGLTWLVVPEENAKVPEYWFQCCKAQNTGRKPETALLTATEQPLTTDKEGIVTLSCDESSSVRTIYHNPENNGRRNDISHGNVSQDDEDGTESVQANTMEDQDVAWEMMGPNYQRKFILMDTTFLKTWRNDLEQARHKLWASEMRNSSLEKTIQDLQHQTRALANEIDDFRKNIKTLVCTAVSEGIGAGILDKKVLEAVMTQRDEFVMTKPPVSATAAMTPKPPQGQQYGFGFDPYNDHVTDVSRPSVPTPSMPNPFAVTKPFIAMLKSSAPMPKTAAPIPPFETKMKASRETAMEADKVCRELLKETTAQKRRRVSEDESSKDKSPIAAEIKRDRIPKSVQKRLRRENRP